MTNVPFEEAHNPNWGLYDEDHRQFHWTQEVPSYVRELWPTFNQEQQVNLANWAWALADQHEEDYYEAVEAAEAADR